jgi:ABC-type transporter Mla MlaB component
LRAPDNDPVLCLTISGPLGPAGTRALCAWLTARLAAGEPGEVRCELRGLPPDAAALDALGRLVLAVRRHGCTVSFAGASSELRELAAFAGLSQALGLDG